VRNAFEKLRNWSLVNKRCWSWDPFYASRSIHGTPGLDESSKSVVRFEIDVIQQGLFADGACGIFLGKQPRFDAFMVVGDKSALIYVVGDKFVSICVVGGGAIAVCAMTW